MKWILVVMALLSLVFAGFSGRIDAVNQAALEEGGKAVALVLTLSGSICLWSGLMEVARQAGVTRWIARVLSPVTRILFPTLKEDPDTLGVISMNMTANLLGLGNAATPLGLEAMTRLSPRCPAPGVASREMITLMVMNSCSIQLIPSTAATLRLAAGSKAPMEIFLPTLLASMASLLVSLAFARIFTGSHR